MMSDATPSQRGSQVNRVAVMPAAAVTIPTIAAVSSKTTMKAGGSLDRRNASHQVRLRRVAPKARTAIPHEAPSKASDAASTI